MNFFCHDHDDHYDNKTQCDKTRQNEDLDGDFFPTELRNDPRVCKKFYYAKTTPLHTRLSIPRHEIHRSLMFS